MQKVRITAPKEELRTAIKNLHNLELLDIEEYDGEFDTGSPFDEADQLSTKLVKVRSLLSKLPDVDSEAEKNTGRTLQALNIIQEDLNELEDEKSTIESRIDSIKKELSYFKKLKGLDLNNEDLEGTRTLNVKIGKFKTSELEHVKEDIEIHEGQSVQAIVYKKDDKDVEDRIDSSTKKSISPQYRDRKGSFNLIIDELRKEIESEKNGLKDIEEEIEKISSDWRPSLEETEKFLTEKVEKTEAPIYFATTERTFMAEGWIPKSKYEELKSSLEEDLSSVHVEKIEGGEPPVQYNNNKVVEPFESLTDLMARPKYGELDPSFMILLTFPIMFGFMIGDAGYGITSALVFLGGMKMFPQAAEIFKSLLWCSGFTILFGLMYGEMFGFQIYESPLYRALYWSELLYVATAIGVAHVNIGILLGAYNEYIKHGIMAAILEKGSWILLQISAVLWFFLGTSVGAPLVALSVLMLFKGEGIEGIVEIPSIISNILSYLRLFGVSMAAYMLANTANSIADPAFASGGLLGLTAGTLILMAGHTINTFIKIMEGFLQGIRLHYVEHFNWYYEGGGRKYNPFGTKNT